MTTNIWAVVGTVSGFIPVTALTGSAGQIFAMNEAGTAATWKNWLVLSDQLQGPAGTVGAPSLAFVGDLTSGWYRPAADQWALAISGSQAILAQSTKVTYAKNLVLNQKLLQLDIGSDITAAATTDLDGATGNSLSITHAAGILAITSLGAATMPAGTVIRTRFDIAGGTLSLTHRSPQLVLLGATNITLQNGDWITWRKTNDASANWEMIGFQRGVSSTPLTNKGDWLLGAGGGATAILPVGTNGQLPIADSTQASGVRWGTPSTTAAVPFFVSQFYPVLF